MLGNMKFISHLFALFTREISAWSTLKINFILQHIHALFSIYIPTPRNELYEIGT